MLAVLLSVLLAGAPTTVAAADAPTPFSCPDEAFDPGGTDLVGRAIELLAASGRDPAAHTVALRLEEPGSAGFVALGAAPTPSVVFLPRTGSTLYPVRVTAYRPCALTWVWDPPGFTRWQRRVVERASAVARERGPRWSRDAPLDVEVFEAGELLGVLVRQRADRGTDSTSAELRIALDRHDLSVIETRRHDVPTDR